MKKYILALCLSVSTITYAQDSFLSKDRMGVEVGGLYVDQGSDGGESYTALPMLNYKILSGEKSQLNAQVGATALKEKIKDENFFVGVLRVNPIYVIGESKISVEGLLGAQIWSEGESLNYDLGARVNYNINELSKKYLDEVFIGAGVLVNDVETFNYGTVGVKKWF